MCMCPAKSVLFYFDKVLGWNEEAVLQVRLELAWWAGLYHSGNLLAIIQLKIPK